MTSIVRRVPFKPIAAILLALSFSGSGLGDALRAQAVRSPEERIQQQISTARAGSIVTIAPGQYGMIRLADVHHDPAVEVRMSGVTVEGLYIRNASGLSFVGGTVDPNDTTKNGVDALGLDRIRFDGMTVTRALRGFTVGRGRNIEIVNNVAHSLRSDGFNAAAVQHVLISGNVCRDFKPILGIRDPSGKLIRDGDHPDCIQSWSRRTEIPNVDIIIRDNRIDGHMQGIFLGDHVTNGVSDGGYDRVQIINNIVNVGAPTGIALGGGRDSRVTGNRVTSLPGYRLWNGEPIRTFIRIDRPVRTVVCNNTVEDFPDSPPTVRCQKP